MTVELFSIINLALIGKRQFEKVIFINEHGKGSGEVPGGMNKSPGRNPLF